MIRKFRRDMLKRVYGKENFKDKWSVFQRAKYKNNYYRVCLRPNKLKLKH